MNSQDVRIHFPSLKSGFVYLENAGGSQVPASVIEAIREHMENDYVQLGAGYRASTRATETVALAHQFAGDLFNADESGAVILGASTTALIHMVANAFRETISPGDEVIIAETNHEANAGAWENLARDGAVIKKWPMNQETFTCDISILEALLTSRTRLVAMPHVSNIVGKEEDVKAACAMAHRVGAKICVDGVAFAPHRAIDVQDLDADLYVFSLYKVYGPHIAALYAKKSFLEPLNGPNHSFIPNDSIPYKWQPGGVSHEACAGLLGLKKYLENLSGSEYGGRSSVEKAFEVISCLEKPVETSLRSWVGSRKDLKLIGPETASPDTVATVSFTHDRIPSDVISSHIDKAGLGIRHGNMYAVRILDALSIPRDPGVVRVSAVHYNTPVEIERLIEAFENLI